MMGRPLRIWMPTVRSGSGADIFAIRLADGLRRAGHDPVLQWLDLRYELAPWLLKRLTMPAGTDVVHAGSMQAFALRREGVPLVVTEHQYLRHPAFVPYSRGLRRLYQTQLLYRYMNLSYDAADRLVAVSQHCALAMRKDLSRGVEVIHNWVDVDTFPAPRDRDRAREQRFRLLFVGNPSPWKGADVLPRLAVLLGDGFAIDAMGGLRKGFEIPEGGPNNLQPISSRPPSGMPEAYAAADAVLVVSRYESFGYVALEAMASGRPVVGFDAPGTNEVCMNGTTALLVPVDDVEALASACRLLATDTALAARLGDAGRRRTIEHFSERDAIDRYVSLYSDAIASRTGGSVARSL